MHVIFFWFCVCWTWFCQMSSYFCSWWPGEGIEVGYPNDYQLANVITNWWCCACCACSDQTQCLEPSFWSVQNMCVITKLCQSRQLLYHFMVICWGFICRDTTPRIVGRVLQKVIFCCNTKCALRSWWELVRLQKLWCQLWLLSSPEPQFECQD